MVLLFKLLAHVNLAPSMAYAQHLGVTCGWSYGNDLTGPYTSAANNPLFNPIAGQPNATWDNWAEELVASGVAESRTDQLDKASDLR